MLYCCWPLTEKTACQGTNGVSGVCVRVCSKLFDVGVRGLVSMLNDLGWFYTAVSRTKTRNGPTLDLCALPTDHIKTRRLDVLAEMARLQVLHEETRVRVHTVSRSVVSHTAR